MTELGRLINELRGEKHIETVCDDCQLSRQTFLLIRRHGQVKLSTITRLLDYFRPPRVKKLAIIRAWVLAQVGPRTARDLQIKIRSETRTGRPRHSTFI